MQSTELGQFDTSTQYGSEILEKGQSNCECQRKPRRLSTLVRRNQIELSWRTGRFKFQCRGAFCVLLRHLIFKGVFKSNVSRTLHTLNRTHASVRQVLETTFYDHDIVGWERVLMCVGSCIVLAHFLLNGPRQGKERLPFPYRT